jgi:hypothetical protein
MFLWVRAANFGGNYINFASLLYEIEAKHADDAAFLYEIGQRCVAPKCL